MRNNSREEAELRARVAELVARFGEGPQCVAWHLCDRHDPGKLAYRILAADGSVTDLTYGMLKDESERLASGLRGIGIGAGDRVATLMGKSRHYLVTLMAIWRLGAVHLPLFTAFAPSAIAYRLTASHARLVVCDASQLEKLRPGDDIPADAAWSVVTTDKDTPGLLQLDQLMSGSGLHGEAARIAPSAPFIHIFTSGTTGKAKGLTVPVRALAAIHTYMDFALNLTADDTYWCAADPGWAYGLYYGVVGSFLSGTTSLLLEGGFSPTTTMAVLAEQKVTNFAAAPTVYRGIRAAGVVPDRPLALRCASSAGEPLTVEVNDWSRDALGVDVHDHYGQTEAGMLINNHHHPLLRQRIVPGSMGRAMPGWTVTILREKIDEPADANEVGRVAVLLADSPLAWFTGYIDADDRTAERFTADGRYYLTGDVGWRDAEGSFHFSARDDDVILMAGYRIGPGEIENIISQHEAVSECGVTAVPDAIRGEVMEAFVVLREGFTGDLHLEAGIQQWVKLRYAAHAYPRMVHFVDMLPRTPSGKLQRSVLKQRRMNELAKASS